MSSSANPDQLSAQDSEEIVKPRILVNNASLTPGHLRIMHLVVAVPVIGTAIAFARLAFQDVAPVAWVTLVAMYLLTGLGIEFGYHRLLSHRALQTGKVLEMMFSVLGSMAGQGRLLYWIANHRRHHQYSDTADDPHSPHLTGGSGNEVSLGLLKGLWHAHVGWVFSKQLTNCALFAADILRKPHLMWVDRHFLSLTVIGLVLPAALCGAVAGTWNGAIDGLLWGGFARIVLINQATWSVASLCHVFGARPFKTDDHSGNLFLVALVSFGAGWQNNHHAFPNSATTSIHWWQADITKWFINLLSVCGLVSQVRVPDKRQIIKKSRG